jgi:hypothetical protein
VGALRVHRINIAPTILRKQSVDYADGDPLANLELVRDIFFANPGYALVLLL